eukprot:1692451-Rhodomonas_salina.2
MHSLVQIATRNMQHATRNTLANLVQKSVDGHVGDRAHVRDVVLEARRREPGPRLVRTEPPRLSVVETDVWIIASLRQDAPIVVESFAPRDRSVVDGASMASRAVASPKPLDRPLRDVGDVRQSWLARDREIRDRIKERTLSQLNQRCSAVMTSFSPVAGRCHALVVLIRAAVRPALVDDGARSAVAWLRSVAASLLEPRIARAVVEVAFCSHAALIDVQRQLAALLLACVRARRVAFKDQPRRTQQRHPPPIFLRLAGCNRQPNPQPDPQLRLLPDQAPPPSGRRSIPRQDRAPAAQLHQRLRENASAEEHREIVVDGELSV